MKKPSRVSARDPELESLKRRVASLERTSAAMSARMISLFGAAAKHVDVVAGGATGPAITPAAR